jgi:hypothetical protein
MKVSLLNRLSLVLFKQDIRKRFPLVKCGISDKNGGNLFHGTDK